MGNVYRVLSGAQYDPRDLPYGGRFVIELCETVHIHLGNLRLEWTRDQFFQFAEHVASARKELEKAVLKEKAEVPS